MRKRWSISYDSGTNWTVVSPLNGSKLRITEERDLDSGQIFFRKKLSSAVVLGGADYTDLLAYETDAAQRCTTLYMRLEFYCEASWQEFWRGQFSAGSCDWERGLCLVEVKPETVDRYTCLLEQKDVKRNVLQVGVNTVEVLNLPPNVQIWATSIAIGTLTPFGWSLVDTDSVTYGNFGTIGCGGVTLGATQTMNIVWRQVVDVDCVAGLASAPSGSGWVELSADLSETANGGIGSAPTCAGAGKRRFVRTPPGSWPFPNDPIVLGDLTTGIPNDQPTSEVDFLEPTSTTCLQWMRIGALYNGNCEGYGMFVCIDQATTTDIERARVVEEALEYILEQSGCEIDGIRSDFFEWNPPGDAPGYVAGENYVTGEANQLDNLLLIQKSDAINPSASNPATIGEMSFADLMTAFNVMFQVFWDIDDDGYLRLEHWKYWTFQQGQDITALDGTVEQLRYDRDSDKIPRVERAEWMEAQGRDFVGLDIVYSAPCVSGEATETYSPGKITTDIAFVLSDPQAISRSGFVFLACVFDSPDYSAIVDEGAISEALVTNAPLSWANLQRDYWTWNRYQPTGSLNGAATTFDGYRPNITQSDVRVRLCCDLLTFDPKDYLTTALGTLLGVTEAIVESVDYDLSSDRVGLTIKYAY